MERIIPKKTKVGFTFFNGIKLSDILIVASGITVCIITFFANFGFFRYILMGLFALLTFLAVLGKETKGWKMMLRLYDYKFRTKKLSPAEALVPMLDAAGDLITYNGYFGKVLEVKPIQFNLLSEENQNILISAFGEALRELSGDATMQLVKLDRELDFGKNIRDFEIRKQLILSDNNFTDNEKEIRIKVLESEIETLTNFKENKLYYSGQYIVVYGSKIEFVDETIGNIVQILDKNNITTECLADDALLRFLKCHYYNKPDEDEVIEDKTEYITPKSYVLNRNHVELDGQKQINLVVKNYPTSVGNAWGEGLFDMENTKVVLSAVPADKNKLIKQLDTSITEMREKTEKDVRESVLVESLTHLETLQNLLVQLKNDNEAVLEVNINITYYPQTENINAEKKELIKRLQTMGFEADELWCRQFEGLVGGNLSRKDFLKDTRQGINSETLAAVIPWTSNNIIERDGVLLGVGQYPVLINYFKRDNIHQNSNMFVVGSSGAGKSYFVKTLCTLLASNGERIYILDPHNEYVKIMESLGGRVVDVSGGDCKLNPLQVVYIGHGSFDSHLQFLEEFFKVTCPNLPAESFELLNRLLVELYDKFNINSKTDILKLEPGDYPIMDNLYEFVKSYQTQNNAYLAQHIYTLTNFLFKFSKCGRYNNIWNGHTTLSIKDNAVVFTFQSLFSNENSVVAKAQMLMLTRFINNRVINNFNENLKQGVDQKTVVVIDEAHKFISKDNAVALTFMKRQAKELRKYNAMQIVATQSVQDFIANEELASESKAVISESQYSCVFKLTAPACDDFVKLYASVGINDCEKQSILTADRGNVFFMGSSFERDCFQIVAGDTVRGVVGESERCSTTKEE